MNRLIVIGLGHDIHLEEKTQKLINSWPGKVYCRILPGAMTVRGEVVPGKEQIAPDEYALTLLDKKADILYYSLGTPLGEDCLADYLWEIAGDLGWERKLFCGKSLAAETQDANAAGAFPRMIIDSWLLPQVRTPSPRCCLQVLQPAPVWIDLDKEVNRLTGSQKNYYYDVPGGWSLKSSAATAAVISTMLEGFSLGELEIIMEKLRSPQGGCPWDIEQTHQSLRRYLLEEAYEVAEAIDEGSIKHLVEELGDLLLQVVFHASIAAETKEFETNQIIQGIYNKLISRHPHVFGQEKAETAADVMKIWGQAKAKEQENASLIKDRNGMPALNRAERIQSQAAAAGFDWPNIEEVFSKLDEETAELRDAYCFGDKERIEEEMGDVFFSLVNLCRFLQVDPEAALAGTIKKFIIRFRYIESKVKKSGSKFEQFSLSQLDNWWNEAKSVKDLGNQG